MAGAEGILPLLDDEALEQSAVVANCSMNRERQLRGVNSYTRELGFDPLDVLLARAAGTDSARANTTVGWLDLCCGQGRALVQAAQQCRLLSRNEIRIVGVDLVNAFDPTPGSMPELELSCASLTRWRPARSFDLITCLHGLHYVGDKLAVLTRAAGWLTETGQLVADLDLSGIRLPDGQPAGRQLTSRLRAAGFAYDARRRRIRCTGRREVRLPYRYLGADDQAGANSTGQPAVQSFYAPED